jgi:hypothetical protein
VTRPLAGLRYDPSAHHGHVESYFLKANDPDGERAIWIRATVYAPQAAPAQAIAETWAIAFDRSRGHVAVKTSVPMREATFDRRALSIAIDGSTFTSDAWRGRAATFDRTVAWDLSVAVAAPPLVHLGHAWLYAPRLPGSRIVSLTPDARVRGEVRVGGGGGGGDREPWNVDGWPAMIGHNWGPRQTADYAWGHCNTWDDPDVGLAFEGVALHGLGGPLRRTVCGLFVRHRGERYDLGGVVDLCRNESRATLRRWSFGGNGRQGSIEGEIWAATDDFVGLYYPDPGSPPGSGSRKMTMCLNSKLAHAELRFRPRRGPALHLRSRGAALELVTRDPNHGVRMLL